MTSRLAASTLTWQYLREADLEECLSLDPTIVGSELVGLDVARASWRKLIGSRAFHSAVVSASPPVEGHGIIGFGSSVFASPDFVERELSNPRPGLNSRIIASISSGKSVVLTDAQLRAANTKGGLDLVLLGGARSRGIWNGLELSELYSAFGASFYELHAGYRLNRMIVEFTDPVDRYHYMDRTQIWRLASDYSEFFANHPGSDWPRDRVMGIIDQQDALCRPGSIVPLLFQFKEPVLGLRDADQELLLAARHATTDHELATRLGMTVPAVKKRWLSVFARISQAQPTFFPAEENRDDAGNKRGAQKRHRVLAYVRAHPEELRPFERTE